MKRILLLSAFISCTPLSVLAASASVTSATFYKDSNFSGQSASIVGAASVNSTQATYDLHDSISSLKVANGYCAILFKDKGFEGTQKFFGPGEYPDLIAYGFNDQTSSLHVVNTYSCDNSDLTTLFVDSNYSGTSISLPIGYIANRIDDANWSHNLNDKLTSIKLGSDACVILYQDSNLSGASIQIKGSNVSTLVDYGFNDKVSSFAVVNASQCTSPATPGTGSGGGTGGGGGGSHDQN